jgi:hypothetical protein
MIANVDIDHISIIYAELNIDYWTSSIDSSFESSFDTNSASESLSEAGRLGIDCWSSETAPRNFFNGDAVRFRIISFVGSISQRCFWHTAVVHHRAL